MLARLRVLHRGSTLKASRGGIALGEGAAAGQRPSSSIAEFGDRRSTKEITCHSGAWRCEEARLSGPPGHD